MVKTMHVSGLPDERALLQMELDRLAQENADLRGSARIWIRMYEQLLGFYLSGGVHERSSCASSFESVISRSRSPAR
jgi:hypothetical protein